MFLDVTLDAGSREAVESPRANSGYRGVTQRETRSCGFVFLREESPQSRVGESRSDA